MWEREQTWACCAKSRMMNRTMGREICTVCVRNIRFVLLSGLWRGREGRPGSRGEGLQEGTSASVGQENSIRGSSKRSSIVANLRDVLTGVFVWFGVESLSSVSPVQLSCWSLRHFIGCLARNKTFHRLFQTGRRNRSAFFWSAGQVEDREIHLGRLKWSRLQSIGLGYKKRPSHLKPSHPARSSALLAESMLR